MTQPSERFYAFEHLPPPSLVQTVDAAAITALRSAGLRSDVPGWDGDITDAVYKNIENGAAREQNLRLYINQAARSHTKRFSRGTDVDNILAIVGLYRLTGEGDVLFKRRAEDIPFQQVPVTPPAIRSATRSLAGWADQIADVQPILRANKQDYDVYILATEAGQDGGAAYPGTPTTALLNAVQTFWSLEESRPIWCTVFVEPPTFSDFTVTAELFYDRRQVPATQVIPLARAALYEFFDAKYLLGEAISREQIRSVMLMSGVYDVVVSLPAANLDTVTADIIHYCPQTDAAVILTATDVAPP